MIQRCIEMMQICPLLHSNDFIQISKIYDGDDDDICYVKIHISDFEREQRFYDYTVARTRTYAP
jgi:hypothetical protein